MAARKRVKKIKVVPVIGKGDPREILASRQEILAEAIVDFFG